MENLIPMAETAGYFGIFLVLFAESGLFLGVVLPGETLLFTAGLLAGRGYFDISTLLMLSFTAAVLGDTVGYWTGKKLGPSLFQKEDSAFFKRSYVERAAGFFAKHGRRTIFFARFVPIVRTFAPIVAGAAKMKYLPFALYNILGAFTWTIVIGLSAYFLGNRIIGIERYVVPIFVIVILLSFIPAIREFVIYRRKQQDHIHA